MAELSDAGECSIQRREAVQEARECAGTAGRPVDAVRQNWTLSHHARCLPHGNMASFRPQVRQTGEHPNSSSLFPKPFFHATCKMQFTFRKMN